MHDRSRAPPIYRHKTSCAVYGADSSSSVPLKEPLLAHGCIASGMVPQLLLPATASFGAQQLGWRRSPLPSAWPAQRRHPFCVAALKEERKTASGRKGDEASTGKSSPGSMSEERQTASGGRGGTGGSSAERKTTSGRGKDSPPRAARPPSGSSTGAAGHGQKKPPPSKLDVYVRNHPVLSRFYDTTLILGDCVMIAATEASSERIQFNDMPTLIGVMLIAWIGAGAWNGDYNGRQPGAENWYLSLLGPTFSSIVNATVTWAFAATASLAAYSYLVSRNAMDAAPLVEGLNTEDLSPQLEVVVALLITMTCWRGIASKLRN